MLPFKHTYNYTDPLNNKTQMTQRGSLLDWLTRLDISRQLNNTDILSGTTVNSTLTKVFPQYHITLSPAITAASRINNWNILVNQLAKAGVEVTQQMKTKIINGDEKTVYNILYELKEHYDKGRQEVEVDINKIDSRGDPKTAKSLLQLLILVIIKYYGFSVKEAVALLSNDSKYLAHILAKGFKDNPHPVEGMLLELHKLMPQIITFCRNKENETFFLKSIKPALISKFLSISEISLELITQFIKHIAEKLEVVKTQLLPTLVLSLRRHSCQLGPIIHSLTDMIGYNKNLLSFLIQATQPSETYLLMIQILNQGERGNHISEIFQMFRFEQFVGHAIQSMRDTELFINAGTFILKTAQLSYQHITVQQLNKMVSNLATLNLSKKSQVIIFTHLIFALLQIYGKKKNPIAPQLFKLAVDKYRSTINQDESHNYLLNFLNIIDIFPSIPIAGIIQAIMFRYQTSTVCIGQLELQIIESAIGSVDEKGALRVYNIITKIFVQEVGSVEAISNIIQAIVKKFDSKIMFELNLKFMKVCLAIYYANIRKLNYSKSLIEGSVKLDEKNAFHKAKNIQIEKFLSGIIALKDENINISIEPLVCYTFFQAELKNKIEAQGIKQVMLLLGDQEQLRKLYEADAKLLLEDARNEGRKKVEVKKQIVQSKARVNSDASLLGKKKDYLLHHPPKVSIEVQKGLEKYSKAFKQKMVKLSLEEEKRLQDQQKQEELRKKFTLKILEKGVKLQKDVAVGCIFEFNTKQKQLQHDFANDCSTLPFYDPDLEQERDVKAVQYLTKKYNKLFKVYYHNYGGKHRPNTLKLFQDLSHTAYLMQIANVWKLLRDHNLDLFITVKEVQHTVQKINAHLKKQYQDSSLLDFEVFENFLVQASQIMFSRPPKDMRARPISDMLQQIVNKLKQHAHANKIDEKLFEEPEHEDYQSNKSQQVREMNEKLQQNPDYILPEGYKKVTSKKIAFDYQLKVNETIGVHQSSQEVLEVLDEIIFEKFGFHLVQPYSSTIVEATARPVLYHTSMDMSIKERSLSSALPKSSRYKESILKQGIQGEIEGNELNESRSPGGVSRIQNKFLKQKKQHQEQKAKQLEQQQKRRERRDKQLKALLEKQKQKQQETQKQRNQRLRQERQKKEEEKRRRDKYEEELKKKAEQFKKKKQEEKNKEEQQKKRLRQQELKNHQKMKEEIKRKKKMIEQHKQQKQKQQQQKLAKKAAEQRQIQQQKKAKEQERRERQKQMLQQYKERKRKEQQEKQKRKEQDYDKEDVGRSKTKLKSSNIKKKQKEPKAEQATPEKQPLSSKEVPSKDVKVEQL